MNKKNTSWRAASLVALLSALMIGDASAQGQGGSPWSLSLEQRRDYLVYYSPILMIRGNEFYRTQPEPVVDRRGLSWLTNFDFDRDGEFRNNANNWMRMPSYIDGRPGYEGWEIRPTLYTSLIEFMEDDGSKSVVLLYHVYHARDARGIHDWERIEIRVDNVDGVPGGGTEQVRFAVITKHYDNPARMYDSNDLNFQETSLGRHAMIWQAQWDHPLTAGANNHELRFVEDTFDNVRQRVTDNDNAQVNVTGGRTRHKLHYVFVCEGATSAVNYWGARTLNRSTASSLASARQWDDGVKWDKVLRVQYELQDIADIFPTHWAERDDIELNWKGDSKAIWFESPITNEAGDVVEVSAGRQEFLRDDRFQDPDVAKPKDREGYPNKSWMWGTWDWNGKDSDDVRKAMFNGSDSQPNRADASGYYGSLGNYWWQHDYFAHEASGENPESGRWLPGDWYTEAAGGWDGRWVQIFADDGSDTDPVVPSCQASPGSTQGPITALLLLAALGTLRLRNMQRRSRRRVG